MLQSHGSVLSFLWSLAQNMLHFSLLLSHPSLLPAWHPSPLTLESAAAPCNFWEDKPRCFQSQNARAGRRVSWMGGPNPLISYKRGRGFLKVSHAKNNDKAQVSWVPFPPLPQSLHSLGLLLAQGLEASHPTSGLRAQDLHASHPCAPSSGHRTQGSGPLVPGFSSCTVFGHEIGGSPNLFFPGGGDFGITDFILGSVPRRERNHVLHLYLAPEAHLSVSFGLEAPSSP